jgi:hypothetical protein
LRVSRLGARRAALTPVHSRIRAHVRIATTRPFRSYNPAERRHRIRRFLNKRKTRNWTKKVKYVLARGNQTPLRRAQSRGALAHPLILSLALLCLRPPPPPPRAAGTACERTSPIRVSASKAASSRKPTSAICSM